MFGRDDIRRVGDDQVELLALDRLEEAAAPELDVVHAVERCVELRVLERSRVHVRRHDVPRVRGKKDRLDPVAGAHVERSLACTTDGQMCQGDRRAVDARHVVGMHVSRPCVIRRDEQLVVRHQTRGAEDVVPVFQEQAGSGEASAELGPTSCSRRARGTGTPSRKSRKSNASSSPSPSRRR